VLGPWPVSCPLDRLVGPRRSTYSPRYCELPSHYPCPPAGRGDRHYPLMCGEPASLRNRVQMGSGAQPASYQWISGALSPVVKRPGGKADHSHSSSTEVKNMWSYRPTIILPSQCFPPMSFSVFQLDAFQHVSPHDDPVCISCMSIRDGLHYQPILIS